MIYSGRFKVTSTFGERILNGVKDDHKGIDVVGIDDKYVCAAVGGVVVVSTIVTDKSNRTWEWGNYVCVIGDDGRQYYYCHLEKCLVSPGKRVKQEITSGLKGIRVIRSVITVILKSVRVVELLLIRRNFSVSAMQLVYMVSTIGQK